MRFQLKNTVDPWKGRIHLFSPLICFLFVLEPWYLNSATNILLKLLLLVSSVAPSVQFSKKYSILCVLTPFSLPSDSCYIIFPVFFVFVFSSTAYLSHYFINPFIQQIFNEFILCTRYFLGAEDPLVNMIEQVLFLMKVAFKCRKTDNKEVTDKQTRRFHGVSNMITQQCSLTEHD